MSAATCRSCGAPIRWLRHRGTGRLAPIDATPTAGGNIAINELDEVYTILTPEAAQLIKIPTYTNHFATCPNAAEHRTPRNPQPTSSGSSNPDDFRTIAEGLASQIICGVHSPNAAEHNFVDGPTRIIFHCNLPESHEGEHAFVIRWTDNEGFAC